MVLIPKTRKTYCKKDHKHTVHKVSITRQGAANKSTLGWRRYYRKQAGFGGQTRPVFKKNAKLNKKVNLRLVCQECQTRRKVCLKRAHTATQDRSAVKKKGSFF